jgi:hypothetical protein
MEQMKEVELTQHISERLSIWDIIRTKVSRNFSLRTNILNPFYGNCFRRKSKKDAGNVDNIHIRRGYLELPEVLAHNAEIENKQVSPQTNTSARRSQGVSLTQVQVKLKRPGAIRG